MAKSIEKDTEKIISKVLLKFVGKKITGFEFNKDILTITIAFGELKIVAYLNEKSDSLYILGLNVRYSKS